MEPGSREKFFARSATVASTWCHQVDEPSPHGTMEELLPPSVLTRRIATHTTDMFGQIRNHRNDTDQETYTNGLYVGKVSQYKCGRKATPHPGVF